jgi:hypothetical protein
LHGKGFNFTSTNTTPTGATKSESLECVPSADIESVGGRSVGAPAARVRGMENCIAVYQAVAGFDVMSFLGTLIATVVGAMFGLAGVYVGFWLQRKHQ